MLVSQGLWPLPERTPLNAVIHGLIDKGDYTVEKVYFESVPGFFVTGNLYRPKNDERQGAGRALRRTGTGTTAGSIDIGPAGGAEGDRDRGRAVRGRRPQPAAGAAGAAGPDGLRRAFTTT